jgi:hypothetical protein
MHPTTGHWITSKRTLRYVRFTLVHGLKIVMSPSMIVSAYSDIDSTGDTDDKHLTGGFVVYLCKILVSWSAHR